MSKKLINQSKSKIKIMKNIHVLPTDKPSRLSDCQNNKLHLDDVRYLKNYLNIYITSDEEIKEGDYYIKLQNRPYINRSGKTKFKGLYDNCQKIILTTDQDLIKDGVQAIDDEFLEWFVKNPSCESVVVNNLCYGYLGGFADAGYKIIIPKEEYKQETLEEAAEKLTNDFPVLEVRFNMSNEEIYGWFLEALQKGAKWQQERMYSEEEVLDILFSMSVDNPNDITEWFEQFKNK